MTRAARGTGSCRACLSRHVDPTFHLSLTGMLGWVGPGGSLLVWVCDFFFFLLDLPLGPPRGGFAPSACWPPELPRQCPASPPAPRRHSSWAGRPFHGSVLAAPRLAVSVASSTPWPCGPSPQFREALALSPPQGPGALPTPGCPPLRTPGWGLLEIWTHVIISNGHLTYFN